MPKNQDWLSVGTIVGHTDNLARRIGLQHGAAANPSNFDGLLNQYKIYFTLRARWVAGIGDARIEMVPVDDVLQEISCALLECGGKNYSGLIVAKWSLSNFRHAANAVRRMCSAYGYRVRYHKELSIAIHEHDREDEFGEWLADHGGEKNLTAAEIKTVESILADYEAGMTVKEICEKLGVEFSHSKQTAINRLFPRNQKRGGRHNRKGSLRFTCTVCGHARTANKLKNHILQCERKCAHCGEKTNHNISLFGEKS